MEGTSLLSNAERVSEIFSRILNRSMSERLVENMTKAEITYPQMQVMRFVMLHTTATIGDVARGLSISYPSATNMVHRLVRKELVSKEGNTKDRRLVRVLLTEKGEQLVLDLERERAERFMDVLGKMPLEQSKELMSGLFSFVQTAVDLDLADPDDICLRCGLQNDPNCPVASMRGLDECK